MRTIIISGLSGSGKSSVVKTLEDVGFYCVDNLPVPLLHQFFELITQSAEEIKKLALVIDARDKQHIGELPHIWEALSKEGKLIELLFLDTSEEILNRRFSETRHRHPLSRGGSVTEGILAEKKLLGPLRSIAHTIIDTSNFSIHDLRKEIVQRYGSSPESTKLAILVSSFGFKYGLPLNADLVFDVRFLANPFFKDELKERTGLDRAVTHFVRQQQDTTDLLVELERLFRFLIPRFEREGKSYLHIAIGCTGGKHRSVVIAHELAKLLENMGHSISVTHRDLERE